MNAGTDTTHRQQIDSAPERGRVPVTRVVAASLVVGASVALLLVLVVFPGATESVITGSVLLAFGLGWAMMRVLSVRKTAQPQRWTTVPAVAMAVTGVGLLVSSPQDAALSALTWVWPPAMLALTGWMYVQMRRSLTGGGRWLLTPVVVVLAAASVGATVENLVAGRVQGSYPAPGKTFAVDGRQMHLDCRGSGGPTVVLFNGMGEFSASWARITEPVSDATRICAYDRAGQGWSDDAATPQDGITAARDLHALLAAAGERGPYVLVGHSIGGPYAMTYAAAYPEQVAGMVLLDSSSPHQFTAVPAYPTQYALMRRGLALLPALSRVGLQLVIPPSSPLPEDEAAVVEAMGSTPRAFRNGRDEVTMVPSLFEQAQALTTLGSRPLAVVTASENLDDEGWPEAQARMATLSTNSLAVVAASSHAGVVEEPQGSAVSVRAITSVVRAVDTGSALTNP